VGILCLAAPGLLAFEDPKAVPYEMAAKLDRNQNRLSDALEKNLKSQIKESYRRPLAEKPATETVELIVSFSHEVLPYDIESVQKHGGEILKQFTIVHALLIRIPRDQAWKLGKTHEVVLIEENAVAKSFLEMSTRQIGARRLWNEVANQHSYRGRSDQAVAILDTGLDDSHTDFIGRVVGWYDSTVTSPSEPIDDGSHGTHVAGIAAGSGSAAGRYDFSITYADLFPWETRYGWRHYYPVHVGAQSAKIYARLKWEESGAPIILQLRKSDDTVIGESPLSSVQPIEVTSSSISNVTDFAYQAIPYVMTEDGTGTSYFLQVDVPYDAWDDYPVLSGVAPNVNLVGVKVLYGNGSGTTATVVDGLSWIADHAEDYDIIAINASIGFEQSMAIVDTAVNSLVDQGIVFVAAAGNEQGDVYIGSPGSAAKAITVGAVSREDSLTSYSSLGDPETALAKPDVLAPGGSLEDWDLITSCDSNDGDNVTYLFFPMEYPDAYPNDYMTMAGTSMAAPHVTGLVALLAEGLDRAWAYGASDDPLLVKMIILMTAYEVGEGEEEVPPRERGAKDRAEGYGRIAADAAVEALTSNLSFGTTATEYLGSDLAERKVWARKLSFSESREYGFVLDTPSGADFDLYLYNSTPDENGEPQILKKSVSGSGGADEKIVYSASEEKTAYLVAKWASGSGTFRLLSRDSGAPSAPRITSPAAGFLTNQARPTVQGESDFETLIELYDVLESGSVRVGTALSGTTGTFQVTPSSNLTEGMHTLAAAAVSSSGVRSAMSESVQLTIDVTPPEPPVLTAPASGTETFETMMTVSGSAEIGSTVEIYIDSALTATIQTDALGMFSVTVQDLEAGTHQLTAKVVDAAGNRSNASSAITFKILSSETAEETGGEGEGTTNVISLGGVFVTQEAGAGSATAETTTSSASAEANVVQGPSTTPALEGVIETAPPPPVPPPLPVFPGILAQEEEWRPPLARYDEELIHTGELPSTEESIAQPAESAPEPMLPPLAALTEVPEEPEGMIESLPQELVVPIDVHAPPKKAFPVLPVLGAGIVLATLGALVFRRRLLQILQHRPPN
ncbi:MAG: S8 family serine peptidase, partial [Candidatus Omnitrophota bacterium]